MFRTPPLVSADDDTVDARRVDLGCRAATACITHLRSQNRRSGGLRMSDIRATQWRRLTKLQFGAQGYEIPPNGGHLGDRSDGSC